MSWILLAVLACSTQGVETESEPETTESEAPVDYEPLASSEVIEVETRDGLTLVADAWLRPEAGRPALVLLHMIPPNWDRTSWPEEFVQALSGEGWSVVAIDRRGAGDSEGEAADAYTGEFGAYDVEAAVQWLDAQGAGSLTVIGASNGTTSAVDYTMLAQEEGLTAPVALGFMTGGSYTEAQNRVRDLPELPVVFTYSTEEASWSERQQQHDPGLWSFLEYPDGAHGTQMFDAAPEVTDDLVEFFSAVL